MNPEFFPTQKDFRQWLEEHHDKVDELWVGYYKKATGTPSITWPESVDEALCFGWIDGIRKSIDEASYKIRFTPRRPGSLWSAVNLKRVAELIELDLMRPAGTAVFEKRDVKKIERYSYERESVRINPGYEKKIKENPEAWAFFQKLPPSAKKATVWWLMSAKREETRLRRLDVLIQCSQEGQRIPSLRRNK